MKARFINFVSGILVLTLLGATFGCSKRTEQILTGGSDVVVPPVACTTSLFGSLTREGTGDVATNSDVIFRVTASGCSGRYILYVNGQSAVTFYGSNTVFTKRYTEAATSKIESVTVVDASDATKSIVLSSASFNVIAGSTTGACSMVVSPNLLNVNLDAFGNVAAPLPQIQVQVRENANASIILTELKDEVTGRAATQWLSSDTSLASLQQIQITPNVPGSHVLTAKFKTSATGPVVGTCQAFYELRSVQSNPLCQVTVSPAEADIGQNLTFTLTSPVNAIEAFIDQFQVPSPSGQVVVRAANPGDWYVQGYVKDSTGRVGRCYAPYRVKAPTIATFTMNGQAIDTLSVRSNQPVLVQWSSQNADSCAINPGNYTGINGQVTFVNLPANITHYYALVCTKNGQQVSKTFSINVQPATAIYRNTPSQRCNWGQVPSETTSPVYFAFCEYTYRDDCNAANGALNNNILPEINQGTCRQISCTNTATSGRKYARYRCQGTSVLIRHE